jgi:predicted transposase YdaD
VADRYDFDGLLKDMLQHDRTLLVELLAGGLPIEEFFNVEMQIVQQSRADLAMRLADQSILHIEFQSSNDPEMAERMVGYHMHLWRKFKRPIKQVVLYVGEARMQMSDSLDTGSLRFDFKLVDIRSFAATEFLATGRPADCVLAMLARDGDTCLGEILTRLRTLPEQELRRAMAQASVLCQLRRLSSKLKREVETMPVILDISENEILREIQQKAVELGRSEGLAAGRAAGIAEGKAEGKVEGKVEGKEEGKVEAARRLLHILLEGRFGPLPQWASSRIAVATYEQIEHLTAKAGSAASLTGILEPPAAE